MRPAAHYCVGQRECRRECRACLRVRGRGDWCGYRFRPQKMQPNDPLPDDAARLLKIYLSGGNIPGNVNPLVLIEMARRSGEYDALFRQARAIRTLRDRIRDHAAQNGLAQHSEEAQVKAYMLATDSQEETEQLIWLLESLTL